MPFGKHRGKPISEVLRQDRQYLAWFCDTVDGNEVLKRAIRGLAGFSGVWEVLSQAPVELNLPNMGVDPSSPANSSTGSAGRFFTRRWKSEWSAESRYPTVWDISWRFHLRCAAPLRVAQYTDSMRIPPTLLSPAALRAVVEEFVTRDGRTILRSSSASRL